MTESNGGARPRRRVLAGVTLGLWLGACQSPGAELSGLSQQPPLDYAVLVTGGAFLQPAATQTGTFAPAALVPAMPGLDAEPLAFDAVLDVLRQGVVFRRVAGDDDPAHRRAVLQQLHARNADPDLLTFLQGARDRGFDLLLVVEQLQDGPIDAQGVNGRWPVTLATWLLLGVGAFIPDHTFESNATLRVTVRDLQTGRILHDSLTPAGPVDLSLIERSNTLGLVLSILVPPFLVHDDADRIGRGVREVTERRLLLSLARELKGEPMRQRLRERAIAAIAMAAARRLTIDAAESVTAVRLRVAGVAVDPVLAADFEQRLLASLQTEGERFTYAADLPPQLPAGTVQVLVSTLTGEISSATFSLADPQ